MSGLCKCSNPVVHYNAPCERANCLRIPHVYVKQKDSVYPCNETLVIDITNKVNFDPSQLKDITEFFIVNHTPNLKNVHFVVNPTRTSIELHVTSNYSGYPSLDYKFAKVTWKARQGMLSDIATFTIPFKSHCSTIEIPNDKYCDPCNGNLLDKEVDISVNGGPTTNNIDISVHANNVFPSSDPNGSLDISITP